MTRVSFFLFLLPLFALATKAKPPTPFRTELEKLKADSISYNQFWDALDKETGKLVEAKNAPPILPSKAAYERLLKKLKEIPSLPESAEALNLAVEKELKINPSTDLTVLEASVAPDKTHYHHYVSTLLYTFATKEYENYRAETGKTVVNAILSTRAERSDLFLFLLNENLLTLLRDLRLITLPAQTSRHAATLHQAAVKLKDKSTAATNALPEKYKDFKPADRIKNGKNLLAEMAETRRLSDDLFGVLALATF